MFKRTGLRPPRTSPARPDAIMADMLHLGDLSCLSDLSRRQRFAGALRHDDGNEAADADEVADGARKDQQEAARRKAPRSHGRRAPPEDPVNPAPSLTKASVGAAGRRPT